MCTGFASRICKSCREKRDRVKNGKDKLENLRREERKGMAGGEEQHRRRRWVEQKNRTLGGKGKEDAGK